MDGTKPTGKELDSVPISKGQGSQPAIISEVLAHGIPDFLIDKKLGSIVRFVVLTKAETRAWRREIMKKSIISPDAEAINRPAVMMVAEHDGRLIKLGKFFITETTQQRSPMPIAYAGVYYGYSISKFYFFKGYEEDPYGQVSKFCDEIGIYSHYPKDFVRNLILDYMDRFVAKFGYHYRIDYVKYQNPEGKCVLYLKKMLDWVEEYPGTQFMGWGCSEEIRFRTASAVIFFDGIVPPLVNGCVGHPIEEYPRLTALAGLDNDGKLSSEEKRRVWSELSKMFRRPFKSYVRLTAKKRAQISRDAQGFVHS